MLRWGVRRERKKERKREKRRTKHRFCIHRNGFVRVWVGPYFILICMHLLEQQITLYPYMDENNWWTIRKMNSTLDAENEPADKLGSDNETWLEWVRNGDIVRLEHVMTAPRKLHSHDEKAPVTDAEYHKEVR